MRIGHNIPALQAYTSMTTTNKKIDRATVRIASGIRINSVKDDAAGLAISNKLRFQITGLDMAMRNTMDGISVVQVAEGALQEVDNMLQRIRELAVQSSNDTNEPEDRRKIDMESQQLLTEINDTARKTSFNNMKVLFGDAARMAKVPLNDRLFVEVTYVSDPVPNDDLMYSVASWGEPAKISTNGPINITQAAIDAAAGKQLTFGHDFMRIEEGDTPATVIEKFQFLLDSKDLLATVRGGAAGSWTPNGTNGVIDIYTKDSGSNQVIDVSGDADLLIMFNLTAGKTAGTDAVLNTPITVNGEPYAYFARGNHIEMTASNGKSITMELKIAQTVDANGDFTSPDGTTLISTAPAAMSGDPIELLNFGMFQLQIGPNKGQDMGMQIPPMTIKAMQIEYLHLKSWEGAQMALAQSDAAIAYVNEARSRLGAYQNRLEYTNKSLGVTSENTSAAKSRIYDADMAKEISLLSTNNVIMQAGMAIMAQANQRPQQILQLLS